MKKSVITITLLGFFLALALIILSMNFVSASNVCCEKLKTGQWCQSAPLDACDISDGLRTAPTSCESTIFCSVGTCYDSQEGICETGVSQIVCNNDGGVWSDKDPEELPQCQVGCCLLGGIGANLATQVRCKELSSLYGVQTNFNPGITNELQCIASSGGEEKGACVYETGSERTCRLLSSAECDTPEFYEGYLCSDETLGTNCGPTEETTCVVGEDEVRFVDSCGNLANIYDANKINDKAYWSKIVQKEDTRGFGTSNANDPSLGNCQFSLGSTCKAYVRGETTQPTYGNFICKDLGCTYKGVKYRHGEQWCGESPGTPKLTDPLPRDGNYIFNEEDSSQDASAENLPGSVFTKLTCFNNEIIFESCGDGRQNVCVQGDVNGFKNAACIQNSWRDCSGITNEAECMDRDLRKCNWIPYAYSFPNAGSSEVPKTNKVDPSAGYIGYTGEKVLPPGACVPLNAPGFDFWSGEGNGSAISSIGSILCEYDIRHDVGGYFFEDGKGAECLTSPGEGSDGGRKIRKDWLEINLARCLQIGDSGPKVNYLGYPGETQVIAEKFSKRKGEGETQKGDQIISDGETITVRTGEGSFDWRTWNQQNSYYGMAGHVPGVNINLPSWSSIRERFGFNFEIFN